ncbi:MAG: hypothetical protein QOH97_3345 [Actinoplanes sp.]|nr:hypothetical protein [Actinoplanes sp.]
MAWLSEAWLSVAWLSVAWLSVAWLSVAWLSVAWLSVAWTWRGAVPNSGFGAAPQPRYYKPNGSGRFSNRECRVTWIVSRT